MKKFIYICTCAVVLLLTLYNQKLYAYFKDISYKISCEFIENKNLVKGTEFITFKPDTKLNEIHLHFYPHHLWTKHEQKMYKEYAKYFAVDDPFLGKFEQNKAGIDSISINNHPVSFEWRDKDKTIMVIKTGQLVAEKIILKICFWLKVPKRVGRFGRARGLYSLYRFYPILCVHKNGRFLDYPDLLLHQPYISQSARYNVSITLPGGFVAAGTGKSTKISLKNNKILYNFKTEGLERDFYLAFSKFYKEYKARIKTISIRVFYIGNRLEKAKRIASYIKDGLRFYSSKICNYPYKTISVIPIDLGYGGNESSNVVMLDTRVYDLPHILNRYQEFIVVHELGHQWWFNLVGSDEYRQTWMDEGINSFFVQKYLAYKYGLNPYILDLPKWLTFLMPNISFPRSAIYKWRYLALRGKSIAVIKEIGKFKEPSLIFAIAYGKGYWLLNIISKIYGEDKIYNVFRKYAEIYKYKIAFLKDFKNVLRAELGENAVKILDYYLSSKIVDLSWKRIGNYIKIKVNGSMPPSYFWVKYAKNKKIYKIKVKNVKNFKISIDKLAWAQIDPNDIVLELNEDNNTYPCFKNIDLSIVPINHLLYDLPIVNQKKTLRTGLYFSKYGLGPRLSFIYPSLEFNTWLAFQEKPVSQDKTTIFQIEKQAPFSLWADIGLNLIYEKLGKEDIVHRKILMYLRFDLAPPTNNPFKLTDNLTLYISREWQENNSLLYYPESNFSYAGVSLEKKLYGLKLCACLEKGLSFWHNSEHFLRTKISISKTVKIYGTTMILKTKLGLSNSESNNMFYLGSEDGLRAYPKYELTTSNMYILSCDWMIPVWAKQLTSNYSGWIDITKASVVPFGDIAREWNSSFNNGKTYHEVGLGVELKLQIGANLTNIKMRIDFAKDLTDNKRSRVNLYFRL